MSHRILICIATLVCCATGALADPILLPKPDLFVLEDRSGTVVRISANGTMSIFKTKARILEETGLTDVSFSNAGITGDGLGNLYFSENDSDSILKYDYVSGFSTLTTEAAIIAAAGGSGAPKAMTLGADGFLYVQDSSADAILRVDPTTGDVTILASETALDAVPGIKSVDMEGGISASGAFLYATSDKNPQTLFEVGLDGSARAVATGLPFTDLDGYIATAPNGDLIVANDDDGDDIYTLFRVSPDGSVSVFLSAADILAVTGGTINLDGGLAFGPDGSFYLAESSTDNIYRFDSDGSNGTLFVSAADFKALTGSMPRLKGAIVWAAVPNPEPGTLALVGLGVGVLVWRRRRRRAA